MPQQADVPVAEALEAPPEPIRILTPSPLGVIGIELIGSAVTRVIIVPKGRERKLFRPLSEPKRGARSEVLDEALGRLSEYLAGARRNLGIDYDLEPSGVSGFNKRVLLAAARIRYGRIKSYRQIATAAGNSEGYRQVLAALVTNPLPLVIPCHRVVPSKTGVGSYIGGVKKKEWLLKMERQFQSRG